MFNDNNNESNIINITNNRNKLLIEHVQYRKNRKFLSRERSIKFYDKKNIIIN